MSIKSVSSVVSSSIVCEYPEKLKRILENSENPSDTLMKLLGDAGEDAQFASVVIELIQNTFTNPLIQLSEIEFAILSLKNIYQANIFRTDVQCSILLAMVTIFLTHEHNGTDELASELLVFLTSIIESECETSPLIKTVCLDCLIEIELANNSSQVPHEPMVAYGKKIDGILLELANHDLLCNKSVELTSLRAKNSDSTMLLLERMRIPNLTPTTLACAFRDSSVFFNANCRNELEKILEQLRDRYHQSFDLCILLATTLIREYLFGALWDMSDGKSGLLLNSTHPSLPVARNLITLDWIASDPSFNKEHSQKIVGCEGSSLNDYARLFIEPFVFDGADARLKKISICIKLLHQGLLGISTFSQHLKQLLLFAIKAGTSRSLAAVFRVLWSCVLVEEECTLFNTKEIVVYNTVAIAAHYPACLPHVVDFIKNVKQTNSSHQNMCDSIILGIIDSFAEQDISSLEPQIDHIISFFIESSSHKYNVCQPRMILGIVKNCLVENENSNLINSSLNFNKLGLELCQQLIRNQDYEIFLSELRCVLSLLEASDNESDIRQRAWMLRSLITHFNTENLKNAFDHDMDLSSIGRIESTDSPLIAINVLFNQMNDSRSVNWSTNRQRSHRSIYFPLEICFSPESSSYTELIGIRIDFILDPHWGQVESIFIPMLCSGQIKKTCMHLQPIVCSEIIIGARAIMSTTDGRIYTSVLKEIHLKLEHILSPLCSKFSFSELWECLSSQDEKCCSSAFGLDSSEKLLSAVESGELGLFQLTEKKKNELVFVTTNSWLILVRIVSIKHRAHIEMLVEDPSLLVVMHSFIKSYCDNFVIH